MCLNTSFVTGRGTSHRSMKLQPIAKALSPEKTAALPAFHAITGADNAGSLSGKGKVSCWKAFLEADDSVLNALAKLGREEQPGTDIKVGIERFVCQLYLPRTDITTAKELKWFLFKKKQAQSDKLPPTQAAPSYTACPFSIAGLEQGYRTKSSPAITERLWMGNGERRVGPWNDNSSTGYRGCHRACQVWML